MRRLTEFHHQILEIGLRLIERVLRQDQDAILLLVLGADGRQQDDAEESAGQEAAGRIHLLCRSMEK